MDSARRPAPVAAAPPPGAVGAVEAPAGALARLGRLLPGVGALVRFAYRTAAVSAAAAVAIWFALFEGALRAGALGGAAPTQSATAALVVAVLLLVPAAAAALAGWTLADLAALPGQLRDAALAATGRGGPPQATRRGGRLFGLVRALWAARGLALTSRGAWLRAVGAVRFVRLASLPFALALAGLFALNGVVIVGGVVALVVLLA